MATGNPLHKYRSWQYHFIIVATNDKGDFSEIDSNNIDLEKWMHPTDTADKYGVKEVHGTQYVVIYNSMTDTEFFISNLTLTQTFINEVDGMPVTTPTAMAFTITEPFTVEFTLALQYAAKALGLVYEDQVRIQSLRFGLKIVFVGQLDSYHVNLPHIITSTNILQFNLTDMNLSISEKGAVYDIKCVPMINSAATNGLCSDIGGVSVLLSEQLADAVAQFEEYLNDRNKQDNGKLTGPKYKYKFILDELYNSPDYKLDLVADDQRVHARDVEPNINDANGPGVANNTQSTDNTSKSTKPEDNKAKAVKTIQFITKKTDRVQDALYNLLMLSSRVCRDIIYDNVESFNTSFYRPIIETAMVDSKEPGVSTLVFYVTRQEIPAVLPEATTLPQAEDELKVTFPLSYDFIYTGKNVDVLKFDISLHMNFSGIGTSPSEIIVPHSITDNESLRKANQSATNAVSETSDNIKTGEYHDKEFIKYNMVNSDTVLATGVMDKNNLGIGSYDAHTLSAARKKLTNAISLITKANYELEIIGNPILLGGFIPPPGKYGSIGKVNTVAEIKQYNESHLEKTGYNLGTTPTVKINVRVPKPSYLQGASTGDDSSFYSTPFWATDSGCFIKSITSKFNASGTFTQTMSLVQMVDTPNIVADNVPAQTQKAP